MPFKKHTVDIRVTYADTDQMGVVYYSNYLIWFEIARTEFFRTLGLDYNKIEKERKLYLPVVEAYCRYRASVRYDDIAKVTAKLAEIGNSRLCFEYEVKVADKCVTTGSTKHTFVDANGRPVPIPDDIRKTLSSNA